MCELPLIFVIKNYIIDLFLYFLLGQKFLHYHLLLIVAKLLPLQA